MLAYRLIRAQQPPELQDVPQPTPQSGQLLIKVGGCGLCHTDIAIMGKTQAQLDAWHAKPPPFTLGHEIAGWVEQIGPGVVGFKTGEPVAVVPLWGSCGRCPPCRSGNEHVCQNMAGEFGAGLGFDGGLAEYVVVPARLTVRMGELDPVLAAPLTDAGLTTYTAIKPALPLLSPGSTAVVFGIGGLGLLAVQFLRSLCAARVIAVDSNDAHLKLAREHGADHVLLSDNTTAEQIRAITSGAGAAFVLDCVGAETTLKTGVAALASQGRLSVVGAAQGIIPFGLHAIPPSAQLTTSFNGGTTNLLEVLELARLNRIQVIEERYPLTRVAEAYKDLEAGKLKGRAVCVPPGVALSAQ